MYIPAHFRELAVGASQWEQNIQSHSGAEFPIFCKELRLPRYHG